MTELEKAIKLYKDAYYEYYDSSQLFGYTDEATKRVFQDVAAYEKVLIEVFGMTEEEVDEIDQQVRNQYNGR